VKNGRFSANRGLGRQPDFDDDAARAEDREAAAAHGGVRILHRRDDPDDAGIDDPADARAGAALMAAGLERAIERRAAGARPRRRERVHLGMRLAGALVEALADNDAVRRHDDGTNERVGARAPAPARRMKQRSLHELRVAQHLVIWLSGYLDIWIDQLSNQLTR
jgi:hypothetical protein